MHSAMIPVLSSNIAGFRYLDERNLLLVSFSSGATYAYEDVPASVVMEFIGAPSKGQYFGQRIRERFVTSRLDDMAVSNLLNGLERIAQPKPRPRQRTETLAVLQAKYPVLAAMF